MTGLTPGYISYRDCDCEEPVTETSFQANGDLNEGVSGKLGFDSTYENYEKEVVNAPRSDFNSLEPDDDPDKPWRNWR